MTMTQSNEVNFERMRSPPSGKSGGKRKAPRRLPSSPPRLVACRQATAPMHFVQFAPFPAQMPVFTQAVGESERRLYAGFTEPPSPAALPPPPVHWTRPVHTSIAVA